MIINGSINHSYCGRKRKTHRKVKKVERTFRPLVRKEVYRRETEYYPSQEMMGIASKTDDTYKKEVSQSYTLAPAYNKGAYQVIPTENIKDIGR
tara:strand:- start:719 stop:1000 length:282 start_codon:yes stop_codon:yes gene_type:complete